MNSDIVFPTAFCLIFCSILVRRWKGGKAYRRTLATFETEHIEVGYGEKHLSNLLMPVSPPYRWWNKMNYKLCFFCTEGTGSLVPIRRRSRMAVCRSHLFWGSPGYIWVLDIRKDQSNLLWSTEGHHQFMHHPRLSLWRAQRILLWGTNTASVELSCFRERSCKTPYPCLSTQEGPEFPQNRHSSPCRHSISEEMQNTVSDFPSLLSLLHLAAPLLG